MVPTKVLLKRLDVLVQKCKHLERKKKNSNKVKKANKQNEDNMLSVYEHFIGLLYQLTKEVSQTEYNRLNIFIYNSEG